MSIKLEQTPKIEHNESITFQNGVFFEKLLSVEELADALGFAPQTIRNWVAQRQIPFVRIGGKTKFQRRSIAAWLNRKEKLCL